MRRLPRIEARARPWIAVGATLAAVVGMWRVHAWWVSPERKLAQFVGATRTGDFHAMLALADPEDVRRGRLNPESLARMWSLVSATPGGVRLEALRRSPFNEGQLRYNRGVVVRATPRVPGATRSQGAAPEPFEVIAFRTAGGWRVAVGKALRTLAMARGIVARSDYVRLCAEADVAPGYLEPANGKWYDVSLPYGGLATP